MLNQNLYERTFGNRAFIIPFSFLLGLVLLAFIAERLDREVRTVELSQFNYRIQELRSMVLLMNASIAAKDTNASIEPYLGANPMQWFDTERSPVNYIGEQVLREVKSVRGKWVFDPADRVIAYRPKTMTTEEFVEEVSALSDKENELVRVKLLHKKHPEWLRFKVVGLLSKEDESSVVKRQYNKLALAWAH